MGKWESRIVLDGAAKVVTLDQLSLPTFDSFASLARQPEWRRYLESVYGSSTSGSASLQNRSVFPLDVGRFGFFYFNHLPHSLKVALAARPVLNTRRPVGANGIVSDHYNRTECVNDMRILGDAYVQWGGSGGRGAGGGTVWAYRHASETAPARSALGHNAVPDAGFPSHSRVEVYHCSETKAGPTSGELWMYLAPGSGFFYDLGRTYVARNYTVLRATTHGAVYFDDDSRALREQLRREGFDSIQYTHQFEDCIYKYEIVDLRGSLRRGSKPTGACPDQNLAHHFTRGWGGGSSCPCSQPASGERPSHAGQECLNCGERAFPPDVGEPQDPAYIWYRLAMKEKQNAAAAAQSNLQQHAAHDPERSAAAES